MSYVPPEKIGDMKVPVLTAKVEEGKCEPYLLLNGQKLPLRSVNLHIGVDEIVTADIELFVRPDVEIRTLLERCTIRRD